MVHIVVTMIVKEGRMKDFLGECEKLRPLVLEEKGCIAYDYVRDIPSPLGIQEPLNSNRVTLIERWESMDALKAHTSAPHMKDFGPRVKDMRESVVARVMENIF